MQIYCYSCEKNSSCLSQLKCQNCASEAVELTNNRYSQYPHNPHNYQHTVNTSPSLDQNHLSFLSRSMLSHIDQIMNSDPFFSRRPRIRNFPNLFPSQTIFPQFGPQLSHSRFIIQRVRQNPISSEYQLQFNSGDQNFHYRWQSQQPQQRKEIKLQNYPQIEELKQECSICHTSQSSGIVLPCGHQFHKNCLQPWIEVKDNCPCCRKKL